MKKVIFAIVLTPFIIIGALYFAYYIHDIIPDKLMAAREIRKAESDGSIIIQEGKSKNINGINIAFDLLPVVYGKLTFTVDGEKVFVSDWDFLAVGDQMYRIHGWGIGSDAWVSLTLKN